MAALRVQVRLARRRWRSIIMLGAVALLATVFVAGSSALVGASVFEGGDGNLVVDTAGNTDWANAPNLVASVDQPSGTGDNSFGQGTKEDNAAVSVVTGSIPPNKSDLTRFYVANELVGTQNFLYLSWERSNVLGSANMDFELNQKATTNLTGTFTGPITINRTAGDLLVTYDFTNGGAKPVLGLLTWVTTGATSQCYSSSSLPCWGKHIDLTSANSDGAINTGTVTDPIDPNAPRSLAASTFGEAEINLTGAGIFPANSCEAFASSYLKSRSSASFSAEVKDFVAPQPVNVSNCATIKIHKVTENADGTFGYSATGGLTPSTFSLKNGGTQTYSAVQPGSYSVTESTLPNSWTLKDLSCTATGATSATPNGATVAIGVTGQGIVDCTYTNHINLSPTIGTTLSSLVPINTGTAVHDSSTLTGATSNASGTVTYSVYDNATCSGNPVASGGAKTVTNGTVPDSDDVTLNTPGTYYWQASYGGDGNNNPAKSVCTSEQLIVKNNPSISTTLSSLVPVNTGTAVHDSATLSNATADAGGTATYSVYDNATCSGNPVASGGAKTVSGGSVPNSSDVTLNTPGTYYWQVVYSGDSKNNGATSVCTSEQLIVKNNPSISTTLSSLVPVDPGTAVHDSATLSNATADAGGTATYSVYDNATCSGNPVASGGAKTVSGGSVPNSSDVTLNTPGTYYWQVVYSGDSKNNGATSVCTSEQLIVKNNPSISTTLSSLVPVSIGTAVHDSATLGNATADAGGTATYSVYDNATCSGNAVAGGGTKTVSGGSVPDSDPVTFNSAGTYYWQVVYSGDSKNNGATSVCTSEKLVVNPNKPGMTTAQDLLPNDSATITGATGNAGGNITFELFSPSDATCAGAAAYTETVNVSGNKTYKTSNLAFHATDVGTWRWRVTYSGDSNNEGTTSACGVERFTIANT